MLSVNIYAAWAGILLGCVAGAIQGLFFNNDNWLGGYASWRRRLLRLGHISFFGTAFINLAFALSVSALALKSSVMVPSRLFLVGAFGMPLACYLSAFKKPFRHLFPVPVLAIMGGIILFLWTIFTE